MCPASARSSGSSACFAVIHVTLDSNPQVYRATPSDPALGEGICRGETAWLS